MLTVTRIRALKPAQRPFKVFDSDGLFLLVQPSGALFWRFRYRKFGVERNLSLGSFPDVTLQQARKGCDKAQAQLIDDIDPAEEKRQRRLKAELAAQTTFKLVAEEFIQKMEREGKSPATIKKARWFLEPASSRARSHTSRAPGSRSIIRTSRSRRFELAGRRCAPLCWRTEHDAVPCGQWVRV